VFGQKAVGNNSPEEVREPGSWLEQKHCFALPDSIAYTLKLTMNLDLHEGAASYPAWLQEIWKTETNSYHDHKNMSEN
jgi:hypothetical protein